jgi:hypothetical protein
MAERNKQCRSKPYLRRIAAPEFRRGFQPTGRLESVPASRQRRLNHPQHPAPERDSIVADATGKKITPTVGLNPRLNSRRRYAAEEGCAEIDG